MLKLFYEPLAQVFIAFRDYIIPFLMAVCKLAWNGFNFASREQAYGRWYICERCPHLDQERISCQICGCGVSPDVGGFRRLFEKVFYRSEQCPDNPPRWGKLQ